MSAGPDAAVVHIDARPLSPAATEAIKAAWRDQAARVTSSGAMRSAIDDVVAGYANGRIPACQVERALWDAALHVLVGACVQQAIEVLTAPGRTAEGPARTGSLYMVNESGRPNGR